MRISISLIRYLLVGVTLFVSCTKEDKKISEAEKIPDEVISKLKAKGFDTKDVKKWNGNYIVEGDIILSEENLNETVTSPQLRIAETEQYRSNNLVSASGVRSIPIVVNMTGLTPAYLAGIDTAIARFNAQHLRLNFYRTASASGAITISGFYEEPNNQGGIILGRAPLPSGGNPGSYIQLNTHPFAFGTAPEARFLGSTVQHELGHCIGLRHTDYMNLAFSCGGTPRAENNGGGYVQIPGTPSNPDTESWMLACSNGANRTFNYNDIVALNYLYGLTSTIYEGNLVKNTDTEEIFLFLDGTLRHIQDWATLTQIFSFSWSEVKNYTTAQIQHVPRGLPIPQGTNLLRTAASDHIFFCEGWNNVRRWIISDVVFNRYHFNWSAVQTVSQAQLDAYPPGADMH